VHRLYPAIPIALLACTAPLPGTPTPALSDQKAPAATVSVSKPEPSGGTPVLPDEKAPATAAGVSSWTSPVPSSSVGGTWTRVPSPFGKCGRRADLVAVRAKWPHGVSEECDQLETRWRNVRADHVGCEADQDCVLFSSSGGCFVVALNRRGAANSELQQGPCGNPRAGACGLRTRRTRCAAGCCVVENLER
jgi:hypothetical protein